MLQEVETISPTKKRLTINVPSDIIQSETASVYNQIKMTTNIPGFRPGKVPQAILTKKFGKQVEAQVIEKIVPRYYMEAVKEADLEPVSYPNIDDRIELEPGQPLLFSVTVEIKPEIKDINIDGIVLEKKTISIDEADVEKSISSLQESKALYAVSEDALGEGDMAIINNEAFVGDQSMEELTYKEYPMVLGSQEMPAEFSEALTGKKKGDTADVTITFESDHMNKTLAGKEVLFKITIIETKKKHIPPVDDELAKEADCETVDDMKKKIRDGLSKRQEGQINLDHKKTILDELIKRHEFEAPPSMVEGEIESLIHQEKENAMKRGETVRPDDELKKEFEAKAGENVKSVILLDAIGKKEKVEVSDDDVKAAIEEIADRNNLKPEEVTRLYTVREGSMDALKSRLFADKVLEMILEKSTIQ